MAGARDLLWHDNDCSFLSIYGFSYTTLASVTICELGANR